MFRKSKSDMSVLGLGYIYRALRQSFNENICSKLYTWYNCYSLLTGSLTNNDSCLLNKCQG